MSRKESNHNEEEKRLSELSLLVASPPFKPWVDTESLPQLTFNPAHLSPNGTATKAVPSDMKKMKSMARKGKWNADDSVRGSFWRQICLREGNTGKGVYEEVAKNMFQSSGSSIEESTKQILPDFVEKDCFHTYSLNSEGKTKVSQVLCVIHHSRPDIVYCPLVAPVTSLLLHYMECDEAYECIMAMNSSKTYKYMEHTWEGHQAFLSSFGKLVARFSSSVHKMVVQKTGGKPEIVYDQWITWILEDFPLPYLVRIMDCYLMEGLKIFYRVGLAILTLYKKSKAYESDSDVPSSIHNFIQTTSLPPDDFLTVGFHIRGLSRSVIGAYQTRYKSMTSVDGPAVRKSSPASLSVPLVLRKSGSTIVTSQQLQTIWSWVPVRFSIYQPKLVFSSQDHGFSITSFYQRCEYCEPTILLIQTLSNEVFGAYLSVCWDKRNDEDQKSPYFGTGESFLFTVTPEIKRYPWVGLIDNPGANGPADHSCHLFIRAEKMLIGIGGGGSDGLLLEGDLTQGRTSTCQTFNNQPLSRDQVFQCKVIEVVTFEDASPDDN